MIQKFGVAIIGAMNLKELKELRDAFRRGLIGTSPEMLSRLDEVILKREKEETLKVEKVKFKKTPASKELDKWLKVNGNKFSCLMDKSHHQVGIGGPKGIKIVTARDLVEVLTNFKPDTPITWELDDNELIIGDQMLGGEITGVQGTNVKEKHIANGKSKYCCSQIIIKVGSL